MPALVMILSVLSTFTAGCKKSPGTGAETAAAFLSSGSSGAEALIDWPAHQANLVMLAMSAGNLMDHRSGRELFQASLEILQKESKEDYREGRGLFRKDWRARKGCKVRPATPEERLEISPVMIPFEPDAGDLQKIRDWRAHLDGSEAFHAACGDAKEFVLAVNQAGKVVAFTELIRGPLDVPDRFVDFVLAPPGGGEDHKPPPPPRYDLTVACPIPGARVIVDGKEYEAPFRAEGIEQGTRLSIRVTAPGFRDYRWEGRFTPLVMTIRPAAGVSIYWHVLPLPEGDAGS
jgi:hypothetical protein